MKAKIKCMHITFVATFKDEENGDWHAEQRDHEVVGYEGKVTLAAAEREMVRFFNASEKMFFYNILDFSAVTKTIEI